MRFQRRHIGVSPEDEKLMLDELGVESVEALLEETIPSDIRLDARLDLPDALSEHQALSKLKGIMGQNEVLKSYLGLGYHGTLTPPVILRNILENPGWYTAYTPYQAEISQGRLEMLLNFQTMVCDLTGLDVANASLLDEGSAAAEAVALCAATKPKGTTLFVDENSHSHVIAVVETRAKAVGIEVEIGDPEKISFDEGVFAVLLAYPDTEGCVRDLSGIIAQTHEAGALAIVDADLLALTLLKSPGDLGADICIGNSQRFGVPLGFGGPHAAFIAVKDALKRKLPGRLVGVSLDRLGNPALRLSMQTREQHIRRDKATSNICTAQVLLAVTAVAYGIYHGPEGLKEIAQRIHGFASMFKKSLSEVGYDFLHDDYFDTLTFESGAETDSMISQAREAGYNLRKSSDTTVTVAFDETTVLADIEALAALFKGKIEDVSSDELSIPKSLVRDGDILKHEVFHEYRSESEMLRYLRKLQGRDLALDHSMIPLGSCTMKLNATAEMLPVTWSETGAIHPYTPTDQVSGYLEMLSQLEDWLAEITGFDAVSLQPNAGSQGEYAGLLAIARYHQNNGDDDRNICLIPSSAHGTNPASAVMAGMKVVAIRCDEDGNIDLDDLIKKVEENREALSALMVTYPSTHGVFEEKIREICQIVHDADGQVYMDGANMNAQVGLTSPAQIGADVCHLNLHKTFCIPHGGGGPGVGPIGVAKHLTPFLPGHELLDNQDGTVCSAPYGSASINVISWMYIAMMSEEGLTKSTEIAILSANYIANRLEKFFPVLYKGSKERVAHECIIDLRNLTTVSVEDVAKRLIDYGFHAPTMSWPVAGTLMIEPTESENKGEIDRFCDAMISIYREIEEIESKGLDPENNVLKNAPHTAVEITSEWTHPYSREKAVFPAEWTSENKFWPKVARIDNVYGDRNLICTCEGMEAYETD